MISAEVGQTPDVVEQIRAESQCPKCVNLRPFLQSPTGRVYSIRMSKSGGRSKRPRVGYSLPPHGDLG